MKLKKIPSNDVQCSSISVHQNNNKPLGIILCSGEFLPDNGAELTTNEMNDIINIMENFSLFYMNIKE